MKNQIKIAAIAGILAFASCSKDAANEETEAANLSTQIGVIAKEQTPNAAFDAEKKGIYKGIIAAGDTQDRGVIWINAENNGTYTAYAEMVGGEIINYTAQGNLSQETADMTFSFVAPNSSFTLDLSQAKATVTNVTLNNELYFIQVAKATSTRMPIARTGTFNDPENPFFAGTWNLMTDGTPASLGGEIITMAMTTFSGYVYTDDVFDTFNFFNCGGVATQIPELNATVIFAGPQTSDFGGTTNWEIVNNGSVYVTTEGGNCTPITSGLFSWSDANEAYDGIILID